MSPVAAATRRAHSSRPASSKTVKGSAPSLCLRSLELRVVVGVEAHHVRLAAARGEAGQRHLHEVDSVGHADHHAATPGAWASRKLVQDALRLGHELVHLVQRITVGTLFELEPCSASTPPVTAA